MRQLKTFSVWAALVAAAVSPAAAYYHYVHYLNGSSPYSYLYEKFDLTALPDHTVTFFVSDNGPTSYTPNDSFPSLLEQIRNATQAWNAVPSSSLRVAFGGLQAAATANGLPAEVPTGEVVFEELPPGLLAYAGPAVSASVATAADGTQFVPILQSLIRLNINMTQQSQPAYVDSFAGPSYSESFFTTVVHEIGHCLGLQHTYSSAAMSTAVSRATSRLRPLDADDIAGLSLLYPAGGFPAGYGTITGQVTMNGDGVHLASVVAILPNGSAVSTLTLPDGTYEIDGLQAGSYWVYVHPLPPTAYVLWPLDPNGNPVQAGTPFVSTFYPGTWDPAQATQIPIIAGGTQNNVNFPVQPRSAVEVYDVTSYSYINAYTQPAFLEFGNATQTVVAQGTGLTSGTSSTPVQSVTALGATGGPLQDYAQEVYPDVSVVLLAMYFDYLSPPPLGPEHLLFTLPDDIFVLPQAIQMVQNPPPQLSALTANSDGSVTVTGTNLNAASQVFFDSLPGQVTVPYDASSGAISVMPPPGAGGQTATLTVFNNDSQNSMIVQSQSPLTYTYPQAGVPAANISLTALPRGVTAAVNVTALNSSMNFVDGMTTLGFGSSDVTVRHLWVISPTQAIANITVSPSAILRATVASVISGFQVYESAAGFQVEPADPNLPMMTLPVSNAFYPEQNSLYPGAMAAVSGENLLAASGTPSMTLGGAAVQILYTSPTQIYFVVPFGVNTGPNVLTLNNGAGSAYPVIVQIDPPPPVIVGATAGSGAALGGAQSDTTGDMVTLTVSGMGSSVPALSRVGVIEGGVSIPQFSIQQAQDGNMSIGFTLTASVTGQAVPVTVTLDGDLSMPFYITVTASTSTSATQP